MVGPSRSPRNGNQDREEFASPRTDSPNEVIPETYGSARSNDRRTLNHYRARHGLATAIRLMHYLMFALSRPLPRSLPPTASLQLREPTTTPQRVGALHTLARQYVPRPIKRSARRCVEWIRGAVALTLGRAFSWLVTAVVAVFPLVREYYKPLEDQKWLFGWLGLFVVQAAAESIRKGSADVRVQEKLGAISDALGGTIERFQTALFGNAKRQLDETKAKEVMSRVLQRIREIAEIGFDIPESCRVRVTVARPEIDKLTKQVTALKVWCYDDDHTDAQYSRIPMGLPGAPAAYETRAMQIIEDVHTIAGYEDRKFRGVLSIPVHAAGLEGNPVAVVSIDVSATDFFRDPPAGRVVRLMSPALHMVAFVLGSIKEKAGNAPGR